MWKVLYTLGDRRGMGLYPGHSFTEEQAKQLTMELHPDAIITSIVWASIRT